MRPVLTLIIFVMSPTLAGRLVTAPRAGADVKALIPWIAIGGFVAALPISYVMANMILTKPGGLAAAKV